MWPGNQFQILSNFRGIIRKKESGEVGMLIRTNFDSFANTYLV